MCLSGCLQQGVGMSRSTMGKMLQVAEWKSITSGREEKHMNPRHVEESEMGEVNELEFKACMTGWKVASSYREATVGKKLGGCCTELDSSAFWSL